MTDIDPGALADLFDQWSIPKAKYVHYLSYDDMMRLSLNFAGWAQHERFTPEQTATFLGLAQSMEELAEHMGPDWCPVKQEPEILIQATARICRGTK